MRSTLSNPRKMRPRALLNRTFANPMASRTFSLRLKPALASRAFRHWTPHAAIGAAVELGLAGIEWSESHLTTQQIKSAIDLREETLDNGIAVSGFSSGWLPARGSFENVVDTALVLGAPTVRLSAATLGFSSEGSGPYAEICRALDIASSAGVTISLAYRPAEFEATLRIVRHLAHPSLRLYWRASCPWTEAASRLNGLRFYVPNVPIAELTSWEGVRISEEAARRRILEGSAERRFAIFDAAPGGTSLPRLVKEAAQLRNISPTPLHSTRSGRII